MAKPLGSPLARLLDGPHLDRVVPRLAPEMLYQIIRHSGLDACGELAASATPEQLASVLDLDLWRHPRPGHDQRFDANRFGEWLELLVDMGEAAGARTLAAMDENLVVAGLYRHVRVFDPAALVSPTTTDDEPIDGDAGPHEGPECELGGYLVRALRADAWDAIVALLLALEADHGDRFHAVMRGVRGLSNSPPEVDGLDDLLMQPEQLVHDVAVDRDRRRAQRGYITPADARAFLEMARRPPGQAPNPIVAAYFRDADDPVSRDAEPPDAMQRPSPLSLDCPPEALEAIAELLAEAGLVPPRPPALLEGAEPARLAYIRMLMDAARDRDDAAYLERGRELAFLANALVAGVQSRSFTPQEASDAAVGVCQLGLELWPMADPGRTLPVTFLVDHDLIAAFEVGWTVLHGECMFVADRLIAALSDLRFRDADIQAGLDALRLELTRQLDAGTPWRARDALEVIAMLDLPTWVSLLGLLDECPTVSAALTAALEGRTGAIRATDFEFISTRGQLGTVREFLAGLPDTLRRSEAPRSGSPDTPPRRTAVSGLN